MWEQSKDKINVFLKDERLYFSLLIIIVALTAFGLGQLAGRTDSDSDVAAVVTFQQGEGNDSDVVVASRKGSKYHLPWCAGAQQMSEENKIVFDTRAEAEAAGYEPAANCKGL